MNPDPRFLKQPKTFWANVRTISQHVGYTVCGKGIIKIPSMDEMVAALGDVGLHTEHVLSDNGKPTKLGKLLLDYFSHRANILNTFVEPHLMDAKSAQQLFARLRVKLKSLLAAPMNKQSKEKRQPAYLTGMVNMLIEENAAGYACRWVSEAKKIREPGDF